MSPPAGTPRSPDGSPRASRTRSRKRPSPGDTDVIGGRIVAQIIDLIIQFVQLLVVTFLLVAVFPPQTEGGVTGLMLFALLSLPLYGAILERYWHGQTVGKRFAGIAVVDRHGDPPTFGQAAVRNVPAIIVFSWVAIAVALASIAMTEHNQRVFDQFAETYVVRNWR